MNTLRTTRLIFDCGCSDNQACTICGPDKWAVKRWTQISGTPFLQDLERFEGEVEKPELCLHGNPVHDCDECFCEAYEEWRDE